MNITLDVNTVQGLPDEDRKKLRELLKIYSKHEAKNNVKAKYYEGDITVAEVNLGIALPDGIRKLEIGCAWGGKAVDVLADRSMFDGFVGEDGQSVEDVAALVRDNRLISEYGKHCKDELTYGCTFATLSQDAAIGCRIRFHTPRTAAAKWDGEKSRIAYGFAVIDVEEDATGSVRPRLINLYTDAFVWVIAKINEVWTATGFAHKMGRPLMEPLIWSATSAKPFGQSRIDNPVRRLIEGYVRTVANATIGLEFATAPQKYLLGVTDEQYDTLINQKFRQYVGSMLVGTTNPDTGEKPSFGQLQQGSLQPHVEQLRILATQFAAATGLSVTDTGVVNDANPTSSDALLAQTSTLVGLAEALNTGNGEALRTIMLMALAIKQNVTLDDLNQEDRSIVAHFRNPARPSVAASADAAVKMASVRPAFADTDVFLEMMGFDQAEIRRIKAQEQRARGMAVLEELEL